VFFERTTSILILEPTPWLEITAVFQSRIRTVVLSSEAKIRSFRYLRQGNYSNSSALILIVYSIIHAFGLCSCYWSI